MHILFVMSDFSRRNSRETGLAPDASVPDSAGYEQAGGNAAVQERMKVEGALGRTFNRIAGVSEGNTDASNLHFTNDDLQSYLKDQLSFASGEFFRGAKISGVADKIMTSLDGDKDGKVTWMEFQVMVNEMRQHLIGEVGSNASSAEIEAKAQELYRKISGGQEGVNFDTLQDTTLKKLPADQEHKKLVAQLAALMVLDIVDLDQRDQDVRSRSIGQHEWMSAVNDFTNGS